MVHMDWLVVDSSNFYLEASSCELTHVNASETLTRIHWYRQRKSQDLVLLLLLLVLLLLLLMMLLLVMLLLQVGGRESTEERTCRVMLIVVVVLLELLIRTEGVGLRERIQRVAIGRVAVEEVAGVELLREGREGVAIGSVTV